MDYSVIAAEHFERVFAHYRTGLLEQILRNFKGETSILAFLSLGGVVIPSELSAEMGVSSARIAVVLRKLEDKGYVTREIDKSDHRKVRVAITDAGQRKAESSIKEAQCNITAIFREMGEDDTRDFVRTVERFLEISAEMAKDGDHRKS